MITTISSHGYIRVKCPDHPDADVAGYRYEHRLTAEKMLGRRLKKTELIHHINGDRQDNRPENLEIMSLPVHKLQHRKKHPERRIPGEMNPIIVCGCGCGQTLLKYDSSGRPRSHIRGHSWRKGIISWDANAKITCACGCGLVIPKYDKWGRPRKFISGHNGRIQ